MNKKQNVIEQAIRIMTRSLPRQTHIKAAFMLFSLFAFMQFAFPLWAAPVFFADANLKTAAENALGVTGFGDITVRLPRPTPGTAPTVAINPPSDSGRSVALSANAARVPPEFRTAEYVSDVTGIKLRATPEEGASGVEFLDNGKYNVVYRMDDPEKLAEFADHLGVAVERLLAVVKTPYYYAEDISKATRTVEDQLRCRVMLRAHEIPHLRTIAHMPQGADKLPSTIQETKVGMLTGSNKDLLSLLASDGQRLKPEIQRGVLELYRKLGRAGLAWEDGRLENMYYLERAEGSWEAGVLDLDRIMPWKDVTNPHFARTHEDMVMIQYAPGFDSYRPLASLVSQTLPQTYAGGNVWPSAAFFNEKMLERWGYITYNRETGLWSGERFDLQIVEEYFPEFRKHVDIDWNKGIE